MSKRFVDKLANYFFDASKLSFAGLVLTAFAIKPWIGKDLIFGSSFTLILLIIAIIISLFEET